MKACSYCKTDIHGKSECPQKILDEVIAKMNTKKEKVKK